MGKLGRATAHEELTRWYPQALVPFMGQAIGDDSVKFWRNVFGHWVGTVTSAPTSSGGKASDSVRAAARMVERRQAERAGRA
jgi:hypothetical protein